MKTRSVACVTADCAIHTRLSTSHCSATPQIQKKTAATLACKYGSWIKIVLYFSHQAFLTIGTVKHHFYKMIILQQLKIRNIRINKFIVLNVCTRWRCQVILIVDDVISSSRIAPNSLNHNNLHATQVTIASCAGHCLPW